MVVFPPEDMTRHIDNLKKALDEAKRWNVVYKRERDSLQVELDKASCGNNAHFAAWLENTQRSISKADVDNLWVEDDVAGQGPLSIKAYRRGWETAFEYLVSKLCVQVIPPKGEIDQKRNQPEIPA
jgi:hypothetical protein